MYLTQTNYTNDMEILASPKNLVIFSGTVLASNVTTADEHGKKYVLAGSIIDVDGNVLTGDAGSISGTPKGILYKTVDVTNGDTVGALIVEGYLRADRILDGYTVDAIRQALPEIKFI